MKYAATSAFYVASAVAPLFYEKITRLVPSIEHHTFHLLEARFEHHFGRSQSCRIL